MPPQMAVTYCLLIIRGWLFGPELCFFLERSGSHSVGMGHYGGLSPWACVISQINCHWCVVKYLSKEFVNVCRLPWKKDPVSL